MSEFVNPYEEGGLSRRILEDLSQFSSPDIGRINSFLESIVQAIVDQKTPNYEERDAQFGAEFMQVVFSAQRARYSALEDLASWITQEIEHRFSTRVTLNVLDRDAARSRLTYGIKSSDVMYFEVTEEGCDPFLVELGAFIPPIAFPQEKLATN